MFLVMVKIVTPGLDPGVHLQKKMMDGRDKPGHDAEYVGRSDKNTPPALLPGVLWKRKQA
jgi:hypothetical protein